MYYENCITNCGNVANASFTRMNDKCYIFITFKGTCSGLSIHHDGADVLFWNYLQNEFEIHSQAYWFLEGVFEFANHSPHMWTLKVLFCIYFCVWDWVCICVCMHACTRCLEHQSDSQRFQFLIYSPIAIVVVQYCK